MRKRRRLGWIEIEAMDFGWLDFNGGKRILFLNIFGTSAGLDWNGGKLMDFGWTGLEWISAGLEIVDAVEINALSNDTDEINALSQ